MSAAAKPHQTLAETMDAIGRAARSAARDLAMTGVAQKNTALRDAARLIRHARAAILDANRADMAEAFRAELTAPLLDRLKLDDARIEAMARGLEEIAALADPVGGVLAEWTRPNGLRIQRVRVPLGVIGVIYESRPNVTADASGLCLKSSNAVILRGGSESLRSNRAIVECLTRAIAAAGLPPRCVQLVPTAEREAVGMMLSDLRDYINVIVPRGGKSLIARVQRDARVPVIGHLEGNCHVYVDGAADAGMAERILLNSKLRRTGICGAAETLLLDGALPENVRARLVRALLDQGCEVRGDEPTRALDGRVTRAAEDDWSTEYLDAIIAVRQVPGVDAAIEHIERYGSHHTEAIVTSDHAVAERFLARVDSAIVLHNASTQFADGGEFGMGAEIGISTDKFHARGPVGVEQLTSYNYRVRGEGQIRKA